MTSQPGQQTITIHILPNISRIKGNQTMKVGQLIEYNKKNILLEKSCRKWGRETSPRPLFVFLKSIIQGKSKWSIAWFYYISMAVKLADNKNKLHKTLKLLIKRYNQFWFLKKGSENSFSTTFCIFFNKGDSHVIFY